ncbi:MAG TPA: hypothetical protein VHY20_14000, partial [Pirellulales bacterium]|nr:hypothetical protein [Pirellulales bacterium]
MVKRLETGQAGSSAPMWRGAGRSSPTGPKRSWQKTNTAQTAALPSRGGPWRWLKVSGLLLLSLALLATLVHYLLFAPVKTPLVAVVAIGYDWHLPPNAWAQED